MVRYGSRSLGKIRIKLRSFDESIEKLKIVSVVIEIVVLVQGILCLHNHYCNTVVVDDHNYYNV